MRFHRRLSAKWVGMVGIRALMWTCLVSTVVSTLACTHQNTPSASSEHTTIQRAKEDASLVGPQSGLPPGHSLEQQLLQQAQVAFREGRYTSPEHDNAFDKFKSVQLINPDNSHARSGLQAILLNYAQLIRMAISKNQLGLARNYLNIAKGYYPANALLEDLAIVIRDKRRELARSSDTRSNALSGAGAGYEELKLSIKGLNTKSDIIVETLGELAQRLKESDESVLIYARSDREGRWIYKQLKDAADGYRVRGDIRVSKSPKVRILPPL